MGTPEAYLPPALSDTKIQALVKSLNLPPPTDIKSLQVTACFHSIYLLTFPVSHSSTFPNISRNDDGSTTLVLRVSGDHIPLTKTNNKVAIMRWIQENTTVPVPVVVKFDASRDNTLNREFMLLECAKGSSVDKMYDELSEEVKLKLVRQLTGFLVQLKQHRWEHCGGLSVGREGEIIPGPVLEDNFWMEPEIAEIWGEEESVTTLNPTGPYKSHGELVCAFLETYIHCIAVHPALSWLRGLIPRLRALQTKLPTMSSLNATPLILAHKDLHFCNIMATHTGEITAILDWEFAGVVPANRWDPARAFLWNGKQTAEGNREKYRLRTKFEEELESRGLEKWWKVEGNDVDVVWEVLGYVRALVEVCPRGQRKDSVGKWREAAEKGLRRLGVQ